MLPPMIKLEKKTGVSGASSRGSHRLTQAMACPKLWSFRNVLQLDALAGNKYLQIGTLVHTRLAYFYADMLDTKPEWYTNMTLEEAIEQDSIGVAISNIEKAENIADAWMNNADSSWEPVSVEHEYRAELGACLPNCPTDVRDEVITCRTDLIAYHNGDLVYVDHKTCGRGHGSPLPKWAMLNSYNTSLQPYQNIRVLQAQPEGSLPGRVVEVWINRLCRDDPYPGDRQFLHLPKPAFTEADAMIVDAVRRERRFAELAEAGEPFPGSFGYHCTRCPYNGSCFAQTDDAKLGFDTFVLQGRGGFFKRDDDGE